MDLCEPGSMANKFEEPCWMEIIRCDAEPPLSRARNSFVNS